MYTSNSYPDEPVSGADGYTHAHSHDDSNGHAAPDDHADTDRLTDCHSHAGANSDTFADAHTHPGVSRRVARHQSVLGRDRNFDRRAGCSLYRLALPVLRLVWCRSTELIAYLTRIKFTLQLRKAGGGSSTTTAAIAYYQC